MVLDSFFFFRLSLFSWSFCFLSLGCTLTIFPVALLTILTNFQSQTQMPPLPWTLSPNPYPDLTLSLQGPSLKLSVSMSVLLRNGTLPTPLCIPQGLPRVVHGIEAQYILAQVEWNHESSILKENPGDRKLKGKKNHSTFYPFQHWRWHFSSPVAKVRWQWRFQWRAKGTPGKASGISVKQVGDPEAIFHTSEQIC